MLSYKLILYALALFGTTTAAPGTDAHSAVIAEGQHTAPDVRAPAGIVLVAQISCRSTEGCTRRGPLETSLTIGNFELGTCYWLSVVTDVMRDWGYPRSEWVLQRVGFLYSTAFKTVYTTSYSCDGVATAISDARAFKIVKNT
ncbi:hypothetical protein C8R47DRAFT_1203889 [Mycena vitilis]|nr:hypothetical protein C8R47DRAFT_1203889 [Mycena vitilis]